MEQLTAQPLSKYASIQHDVKVTHGGNPMGYMTDERLMIKETAAQFTDDVVIPMPTSSTLKKA